MMEKTALGSRSNCAAHAWPNQVTGAASPNGSLRTKSEAQIALSRHHHSSVHTPRSQQASRALITSGYIGSSPERVAHSPTKSLVALAQSNEGAIYISDTFVADRFGSPGGKAPSAEATYAK
jgi:hypothetical protein